MDSSSGAARRVAGCPFVEPQEAIVGSRESEAWMVLETPGYWRCQGRGVPDKESSHSEWKQPEKEKHAEVSKAGRPAP